MAPIQLDDKLANLGTFSIPTRFLQSRDLTSKSLTTAIIVLAIVSAVLFLSILFVLARVWKQVVARKLAVPPTEATNNVGAVTERKQSNWARKDSNVLWSMYIEEDDLRSQFSLPAKSRLCSIGSVSTDHGRCPLDRRTSVADELNRKSPLGDNMQSQESGDSRVVRDRTTYEQETTPTKNVSRTRARSQPFHHRQSDSLEHLAKRKQSVPANMPGE